MTPIGLSRARTLLAGGVLLLPWLAAADSQPQGGLGTKTLRASAHVDFRIIIPRMLALQVDTHAAPLAAAPLAAGSVAASPAVASSVTAGSGAARSADAPQTVTVYGNGRTIALGATAEDDSPRGLILSAAARKAIAQDAVCAPAPARSTVDGIVCTASSP
jgi:soluble lytic murein transglycosylase-like protein